MKNYSTSEIAKIIKVHTNTVILYEKWGYIEPVKRKANGYRIFTQRHLEQMKIVKIALRCEIIKSDLRRKAVNIIKASATGDLEKALESSKEYLLYIKRERNSDKEVIKLVGKIIKSEKLEEVSIALKTNEAAKLLGVSTNIIIYWERNGLLKVPKNKINGYRIYTEKEIRLLKVIKTLRDAKYSRMSVYKILNQLKAGNKENLKEVIDTLDLEEDIVSGADNILSALIEAEKDANELISYISELIKKHESEINGG